MLPEVREIETLMADAEAWGRLSRNEQAEKLTNLTNLGAALTPKNLKPSSTKLCFFSSAKTSSLTLAW